MRSSRARRRAASCSAALARTAERAAQTAAKTLTTEGSAIVRIWIQSGSVMCRGYLRADSGCLLRAKLRLSSNPVVLPGLSSGRITLTRAALWSARETGEHLWALSWRLAVLALLDCGGAHSTVPTLSPVIGCHALDLKDVSPRCRTSLGIRGASSSFCWPVRSGRERPDFQGAAILVTMCRNHTH